MKTNQFLINMFSSLVNKKILRFYFLVLIIFFSQNSTAASFYWVGGTGNWSDFAAHWATTSGGGVFHPNAPTASDDVYFDANSFSGGGQIVSVDDDAYCRDMIWTGATNTPTMNFPDLSPSYYDLYINRSTTFIAAMTITNNNAAYFRYTSTTTGNTITTGGLSISCTHYFQGSGGEWTLTDNLVSPSSARSFNIETGATLITGGNTISGFGALSLTGTGILNLSSGTGTFTSATISGTANISTGTLDVNGTFNATGGNVTFSGAGNLNLGGTTNTSLGTFTPNTCTVTYDKVGSQGVIASTYYNLVIAGGGSNIKTAAGTVNVSNNLTVDATTTYAIAATTTTITGTTDINGTVTLSTGTLDANGAFDATGGNLTFTGAGNLNLGSTVTSVGTFTESTSTVSYDATADQNIDSDTYYHLIINGSGTKTLAGSIDVNGNLTITAGTLAVVGYTINLAGNLTNAGTTSATTGNVIFDGGAAQTISGAGTTTFHDLAIANTSGDVALSINATVTGTLTMTTGYLVIATTKKLSITDIDDPGISGGSTTSHIVTSGTASVEKTYTSTTKITFPMGDGTKYRPIALTPSGLGSTVWTVGYTPDGFADYDIQPATGLDHVSYHEYWSCVRTGGAAEDAIVELTWISTSDVSDYTLLEIGHYDGTTDWDMIAATPVGDNTSGTLTSGAAVSTFSPFTIGTTSAVNVLPIEIVSFTGEKTGVNNELNWTTASEINNDYFTIEKTTDGINYEIVGMKNGAGNSHQYLNYSLIDYNVRELINYYRLIQTDFDGKYEVSNVISIDNRGDAVKKEIITITNILGQEVNENYRGIVIVVYSDGSSIKVIQ